MGLFDFTLQKKVNELGVSKIVDVIPLNEITLRSVHIDSELDRWEILRRFCLGVGLLQPNDNRTTIVDVLIVLFDYPDGLSTNKIVSKVISFRIDRGFAFGGVAVTNIRSLLRRLKELGIVEKFRGKHRITEGLSLTKVFDNKLLPFIMNKTLKNIRKLCLEWDRR